MKYLIACLGNVGLEYENTRHNIGFKVADTLATAAGLRFSAGRHGSVAELRHRGRSLILLKPSTYMNLSGKAVGYWLQAEKIPLDKLLVVLDDINLPFGRLRMRGSGSDGGHNGLKSVALTLGSEGYARLRCGVGNSFSRGQQVDFVLGEWTDDERKLLPACLDKAADAVKSFAAIGLERTMNAANTAPDVLIAP
ncbi:MAG: aminoacyl-tRNA hydrolase [Prevotellaceae bacterium]|jgi:PTH1 family peptidyl-tRNA hydrolase|nr:aminoacyl-tRNA hydrolase [Prevotellaceae bacterium]